MGTSPGTILVGVGSNATYSSLTFGPLPAAQSGTETISMSTTVPAGLTLNLFKNETPGRVDKIFRRGQLLSAAAYSLGHGTNDAQKTMGIIAVLLFTTGHLGREFYVPFWVILAAHAAMGLGTMAGGWRIVKTMGMRITKLRPVGGFCAETAGALTLIGTAIGGIPVSTTHTINGSIMGVGATQRFSAVRWGVAGRIITAWIFTIPASAAVAGVSWWVLRLLRSV